MNCKEYKAMAAFVAPSQPVTSQQPAYHRNCNTNFSRFMNSPRPHVMNLNKDSRGGPVLSSRSDYISSVSNPFVKHVVKLRQSSSYRHSECSVIVVGSTSLREISKYLQQTSLEPVIDSLFVKDGVHIWPDLLESSRCIVHVNDRVMKKLAGVESADSTEAVGIFNLPKTFINLKGSELQPVFEIFTSASRRILVLEGIQDPGNFGTLIRTSAAFQWDGVFLLPGCCDPFNEKALRASRGSCFQLPLIRGSWDHLETLKDICGFCMYAAHPYGSPGNRAQGENGRCSADGMEVLCYEFANEVADKPLCLVLGSEGKGLSEKSKASCKLVAIPMPGGYESLNVSIAGGIFLFLLNSGLSPRLCSNIPAFPQTTAKP